MSLEVWRTLDGRVLLHQPGRGHAQVWIEVLPEALSWLIEQLQASYSDSDSAGQDPDKP